MCFFLILLFLSPSFAAPTGPVTLATQRYRWSVRWEALTGDKEAHQARMAHVAAVFYV